MPPADLKGATVAGYVFQGSPLIIIDDPSHAPSGYRPVEGGHVRIVDKEGKVAAIGETTLDGRFEFGDLPTGLLMVEVRRDPNSADPDLSLPFTAFPMTTILLGKNYPISREKASEIALVQVPKEALVIGTLQPLSAGTIVYPRHEGRGEPVSHAVARVVQSEEWFFFVDLDPLARFSHPVEYHFVNAQTGEMTTIHDFFWPPRVNYAPLWDSDLDWMVYGNVDPDAFDPKNIPIGATAMPVSEVIQFPVVRSAPQIQGLGKSGFGGDRLKFLKHNVEPDSIFVLMIKGSRGSAFEADMSNMRGFFTDAGVPVSNIRAVSFPKAATIEEGKGQLQAAMEDLNRIIETRLTEGKHSTLIVYVTAHGGSGMFDNGSKAGEHDQGILADEFNEFGLANTKACRVRVILDFCDSEPFALTLKNAVFGKSEHDYAIYAGAAAGKDSKAVALFAPLNFGLEFFLPAGGYFTNALIAAGIIDGGDIVNLTEVDASGNTLLHRSIRSLEQRPVFKRRNSNPSWCVLDRPPVIPPPEDNHPPLADAGSDQTVETGSPALLNGLGSSDPDGDGLTFSWRIASKPFGSNAALLNSTFHSPSLTPDVEGQYIIELVVNDGKTDSALPDTVVVTAAPRGGMGANTLPVPILDTNSVIEDTKLTATGNVLTDVDIVSGLKDFDPDGDPLTVVEIKFIGGPIITVPVDPVAGARIDGSFGSLTIGADGGYRYDLNNAQPNVQALNDGETLVEIFSYTISDGRGGTANTSLGIVIKGINEIQTGKVFPLPFTKPEGMARLRPGFPFVSPQVTRAVFLAGLEGFALIDLATGGLLKSVVEPVAAPFILALALSYNPDAIFTLGPTGWTLRHYDQNIEDFGNAQVSFPAVNVTDAVPFGNNSQSGGLLFVGGGKIQSIQFNFLSGFFEPMSDVLINPIAFPSNRSGPIFSAYAENATGRVLALAAGQPGEVYLANAALPAAAATKIGATENEPRRIRCLLPICVVSNFGSDSLTVLTWDGQAAASIKPSASVGDGPVGIDLIQSGSNIAVVSAGFNDNSYSVTVIAPDGAVISNIKQAAPQGCTNPGHAIFLGDPEKSVVLSCNGSNALAVIPNAF